MKPNLFNASTRLSVLAISLVILLSGCEEAKEVAEDAQEQAEILAKKAQEQAEILAENVKREWNKGMTLEEAVEVSPVGPDGKRSVELCELSNSGVVNFVGGGATALGLTPLIAGQSIILITSATGIYISVAPAIDPTFTSAAVTVAVMYGGMKVYCAKDEILGNQTVKDLIALINELAEQGEDAARIAYAELLSLKPEG